MARSVFDILAEQRIVEAIRRGEFDNLPGAGQPLDLAEDPLVSAEQRMVNRILKNSGFVPTEVTLRREIAALRGELATTVGEERERLRQRLALLATTLATSRRK